MVAVLFKYIGINIVSLKIFYIKTINSARAGLYFADPYVKIPLMLIDF